MPPGWLTGPFWAILHSATRELAGFPALNWAAMFSRSPLERLQPHEPRRVAFSWLRPWNSVRWLHIYLAEPTPEIEISARAR
jgi:hypothetical protein